MIELYHMLEDIDMNKKNVVMTLLEKEGQGEKALVSDGKIIWSSNESGFLAAHASELEQIETSGIAEVEGKHVYCEVIGHEKRLVICGGGHVSIPVIEIGKMMGFQITVLEDRPKFANNARAAGADEVICDSFENGLDQVTGDKDTFFVIVTRGHRFDQICLEKIAGKEHAYIGMIGSRRRTRMVIQLLEEKGIDSEVLHQVHTPIGLNIGAETPAEIAVSIMAEIIEVKNNRTRVGGYPKEMMQAILDEEHDHGGKVLVTIINRRGSAPRETGTKMLAMADGTCIGTIGGGCVEADVFGRARRMLLGAGKDKTQVCHVDMTADSAEDEGMVCGGNIDVLLEVI